MAIKNKRLKLLRGSTYTFNVSDSSLATHPLKFTADSGATEYTTGVTANGTQGQSGATITFVVPNYAPDNLNYYCGTHGLGMGNHILIAGAPDIPDSNGSFLTSPFRSHYIVSGNTGTLYNNGGTSTVYFIGVNEGVPAVNDSDGSFFTDSDIDVTIDSDYLYGGGHGIVFNIESTPAAATWYGDRAIVMGGYHGEADNSGYGRIEYFDITTTGNAAYFGEMHVTDRYYNKSCSNGTRSHTSGGISPGSGKDTMEYVTIGTLGNAQDFGDLLVIKYSHEAVSDGTYGIMIGGNGGANNTQLRDIEYVTIATTGDGTDFGDLIIGRKGSSGAGNGTRALVAGGSGSSAGGAGYERSIEYITMATPGDATSFGDLLAEGMGGSAAKGKEYHFCVGDATRIVWASGKANYNTRTTSMSYAAYDTPGNSVDFGDVTVARHMGTSVDNASRGVFMGGSAGSGNGYYVNTMDYITIQTTGNATDFGDLSYVTQRAGGASGGAA